MTWPADSEEHFLRDWRAGNPTLPRVDLPPLDLSTNIAALESVADQCDTHDPVEKFLFETAHSYADAARMLGAIGTPAFTRYSGMVYGRPDHVYRMQNMTAVDAARFFLQTTDELLGSGFIPATENNISAEDFADWMQTSVDGFFSPGTVTIKLDPELSAKAIAGATRIRVRASAEFSSLDKEQLLYHEAHIHTGTMLNGKQQSNLRSLSLGAPRTTRTQEGLAVMAELVTNAMDITRLRRVALRVLAVQMALDGADFIDVFKFFLEAGQSEEESVRSTQRIFRGGAVEGGVVFTKDAVYLTGLLEVHTYMRIAIRDNRPELIRYLFAGRLTLADSLRLAPLFASGWLQEPRFLPDWAADLRRLAALIAFSAFTSNIRLDVVNLDRILELEDEIKAIA
ncbi:MAG TPA: flavohemoglobin expression-modulating QEGLA motif protein [Dongiaceae bacterium]|nr:flavohemoglobin expression-modulating QEGLA motif protein [Dongiaceae bacterium]